MSKLIGLLNSPWAGVLLAVAGFLFGIGNVPFTDVDSFSAWITAHFPQMGAFAGIVAAPLFFLLKSLKDRVGPDTISKALADGKLDLGDIIGAIDISKGPQVGTYVKSAMVDGAIVTLRHGCNHSRNLMTKLNEFSDAYYLDKCPEGPQPSV